MSWEDLLDSGSERVLPWFGFKRIHDARRSWVLFGPRPPEHGWYRFSTSGGRQAELASRELQPADPEWAGGQTRLLGYLVGDRFIPDSARVDPDPGKLVEQTMPVYCVELGLERFARAMVVHDREDNLVYLNQEFPQGPEQEVLDAYLDRAESVNNIVGVTPALDLAFRWLSHQRQVQEERRRELQRLREEEERKRAEEERLQELMRQAGSAAGRRAMAPHDFESAAREALRSAGAELLDVRPGRSRGEMVVQYRFQNRRFECVAERDTLRIVDAGVCLAGNDTLFTLESLPGVIAEATQRRVLHVFRHVDRSYDDEEDW
jgi:hypothetical protein